jgi:C1A family cysteine protease
MTWVMKHGKEYKNMQELNQRFEIWKETHSRIHFFNTKEGMTSTLRLNRFADWNDQEKADFLSYRPNAEPKASFASPLSAESIPTELDWREKGAVNEIQDQGNCGSCWAFSAIAAMEGQHFVQSGTLEKLSEQQCVDCDSSSFGCGGGW